jgi:hypothetical protein
VKERRQRLDECVAHWNGGNPKLTRKAAPKRKNFLMERSAVADNAASPFENPFPLRRKVVEAQAAIDDRDAKRFLKLLKPARQGWLGHATDLGSTPEMPLARQREHKFELVDQGGAQ